MFNSVSLPGGTPSESSAPARLKVLVLEDDPADAASVLRLLQRADIEVTLDRASSAQGFMKKVVSAGHDVIVCSFTGPDRGGLEILNFARRAGNAAPFIFISESLAEQAAVACLKEGVVDSVLRSELAHLPYAVRHALNERDLRTRQKTSEEHYQLLFEANPQPMWVFDRKTLRFLAVNEAAVRRYGYSREEFLGMSILDIRPKEEVPRVLQSVLRTNEPGIQRYGRWTHRAKDGSLLTVEISAHLVPFRGTDACLVLALDVTETWKNQEKLRQSEEKFSKAFRASPAAITISTKAEGRYIEANDAFLHMLGWGREEVVGRTSIELGVWDDLQDRARMIEELDRTGRAVAMETVFCSKMKKRRTVQLSAELIVLDDTICILAITNDVTESKSLEEQLRQAQKMDAVGQLAGGIAHDFNNMLGVIVGYCDLSEGRRDMSAVRRDVLHIKNAAERAIKLTHQLLTFSRHQILRPVVLNLNTAMQDVLQMLFRVIPASVELELRLAPRLGNVKADPSHVEQIIMNLVVNARDAILRQGKISIETANVYIDEGHAKSHPPIPAGPFVMLSVADTGIGMDSQTMSRIFEPFFTTKPSGQGTGLGLSMVYGAMQQAGGHIEVSSTEHSGTIFRLYFPRINEAEERRSLPSVDAERKRGTETILLVEDEGELRELTSELLQNAGYRVLTAGDAETATARAEEYRAPIHLLLTDIVLPGISGNELAARLSRSRPTMRVLYTSGYVGKGGSQVPFEPSGSLIEKPYTKAALLSELRTVLGQAQEDSGGTD